MDSHSSVWFMAFVAPPRDVLQPCIRAAFCDGLLRTCAGDPFGDGDLTAHFTQHGFLD